MGQKKENRKEANLTLILIALAIIFHIAVFRGKVHFDIPILERLLLALLAIVLTLSVHEVIHWILMKMFGLKNVKIQTGKDPLGFISLKTSAEGRVYGWKNVLILLGPLIVLTIIPDIIFGFSESISFFFWMIALINSAGCCYDIMAVLKKD